MLWDGLGIKVTHFPGGNGVHSAQLVVEVIGKNKTTVFITWSAEHRWPLWLWWKFKIAFSTRAPTSADIGVGRQGSIENGPHNSKLIKQRRGEGISDPAGSLTQHWDGARLPGAMILWLGSWRAGGGAIEAHVAWEGLAGGFGLWLCTLPSFVEPREVGCLLFVHQR